MKNSFKYFVINIIVILCFSTYSFGDVVKEIRISGNDRIPNETILMFADVTIGEQIKDSDLNLILKNLYSSNFFKDVSVELINGSVSIFVNEAPLIQDIKLTGVKAKKFRELVLKNTVLKQKSSFNEIFLAKDIETIKSQFKTLGYYFTDISAYIENLNDNLVNIDYKIDLGEKSKISKISFIGDKIYKDKKLKNVIVSEEFKFWKFISGKKYLNEQLIDLDKRLLKNFYLNNGYYNTEINSSFAKLIKKNEFELIYNINPGKKIFFGKLNIILPADFDPINYSNMDKLFQTLKDEPYSINSVDDILDEVNKITIAEEFRTINASLEETLIDDKLDIDFIIQETDKFFVEKINIFGNNVTRENVIRNQLDIDEGDPYSDILTKKSENNIKSLNFFKKVNTNVVDGKDENSKIINISVDEKPTGEIMAGAGGGTEGGTFFFGVKENNYLGKGLTVDANASISTDAFKGKLSIINPNYNNTDKLVHANIQAIEIDELKTYGYKTNKNGFELGTSFEYAEDFNLGLSASTFVEKIATNSTASARQKAQTGNYFDTFANINFDYDKRNQKFKTSDGYLSNYNVKIPLLSENNTLTNSYNFKTYSELYENNISSFSILLKNATSITNEDIKLTERLYIPSNRLRGFKSGKIGPKDGGDFIGGNYLAAINLQSNLPVLFENSQNLDGIIFFDAANVWGVDYDSSLDEGNKIRSSIGVGVDWLTLVGPLSFSLTHVISKQSSDAVETFRFNLGTTF